MSLFDQRSFSLIPVRARRTILGLLLLATVLAAGWVGWLLATGARDALVDAGLELFRVAAVGAALWFFLLMGQQAQSRADLMALTSEVLTHDIPASIRAYAVHDLAKTRNGQPPSTADVDAQVSVTVQHAADTPHARYVIEWFGVRQQVHIQLNVRQVSLVYYFPPAMADALGRDFGDSTAGAKSAGWDLRFNGVQRDAHLPGTEFHAELAARRALADDFLHNPTERLFISNDIAAMTRAMMISWKRLDGSGPAAAGHEQAAAALPA